MAILLPALQRVKRQAKAVLCQANLKQWGTIMTMYTEDNEGRLPSGDAIWLLRGSYLTDDDDKNKPHPVYHNISTEGIACCPMAIRTRNKPTAWIGTGSRWRFEGTMGSTFEAWEFTTPPPPFRCSYGFNLGLFMGADFIGGPFHNSDYLDTLHVKGRANIPVLLDSKYYNGWLSWSSGPPPTEFYKKRFIEVDLPEHSFCINRHDGYINGLFLDWSVRKIGLKELWSLKWHRKWDTANRWTRAGGVRPEDWPEWMRNFKDY